MTSYVLINIGKVGIGYILFFKWMFMLMYNYISDFCFKINKKMFFDWVILNILIRCSVLFFSFIFMCSVYKLNGFNLRYYLKELKIR